MTEAPDFSYTPKQMLELADLAIQQMETVIADISAIPAAKRSFVNTVKAFENAFGVLSELTQVPSFLAMVSPDKDIRAASESLQVRIDRYIAELTTRDDVFKGFSEYAAKKEKLLGEDRRVLQKRMRDFTRNGLGSHGSKKCLVRKILAQLVSIGMKYERNLREVSDVMALTAEEMKGLPDDYLRRMKRVKGKYLLSLKYPDYNPFMENAQNGPARHRLFRLYNRRCAQSNTRLLEKAILLRYRLARVLGHSTYADYVLSERMAQTKERVNTFLDHLRDKISLKARSEIDNLNDIRGGNMRRVGAWETAYYINKFRKTHYSIDHETIKEFFPVERVVNGLFKTFGPLLGVRFSQSNLPVWHKDVKAYEVRDKNEGRIGYFYLDLFPRPGKYSHSICSSIRAGRALSDGGRVLPAAAIITNFTPPASGRPALLKFGEVETLFHEFGHVAQLLLARTRYVRLSPVNAAWDFVEIPSTTFQQWAYQPEVLRRISGHYANPGKKLPKTTISNLIAAKQIDSGMRYLRTIAISQIDMRYHSSKRKVNSAKVYQAIYEKVAMVSLPKDVRPAAGIVHFMTGYPAGYYSYAWAEVVAADVFAAFKKHGIENVRIGRKYRKLLLEPGANCDANEQIKVFLGRDVSESNFLNSIGCAVCRG